MIEMLMVNLYLVMNAMLLVSVQSISFFLIDPTIGPVSNSFEVSMSAWLALNNINLISHD